MKKYYHIYIYNQAFRHFFPYESQNLFVIAQGGEYVDKYREKRIQDRYNTASVSTWVLGTLRVTPEEDSASIQHCSCKFLVASYELLYVELPRKRIQHQYSTANVSTWVLGKLRVTPEEDSASVQQCSCKYLVARYCTSSYLRGGFRISTELLMKVPGCQVLYFELPRRRIQHQYSTASVSNWVLGYVC